MTSVTLRIVGVATVFIAFMITGCGDRQSDDVPQESVDAALPEPAASPFCLGLQSARDEVLVGEPLTLLATLVNCSPGAAQARDLLNPEYRLLSLSMRRPGADEDIYIEPVVSRDGRGRGNLTLAPGELLAAYVPAYIGTSGWQLEEEGRYTFRADYWFDDVQLTSNAVQVDVDYPAEITLADAAEVFMTPPAPLAFYMNGGAGSAILDEIVAAWPESPHADYARLALAVEAAANTEQPRVQACRALEAATVGIDFDWVVALRALQSLSSCYRRAGMHPESMRVVSEFLERFPDAAKVIENRVN
ncbi:MAG: hypothetical protein KJO31_05835 [Gammaproteobacteria bacterium]|nr:hypothetical protein [Gammaproteobacteria bacterium]